jgi:hypothetical protein
MVLAQFLLNELEAASRAHALIQDEISRCRIDDPSRGALIDKLLGVKPRVEALDRWAAATAKIVGMEREAHGMNSPDSGSSEIDNLLRRIASERDGDKAGKGQPSPDHVVTV